MSTYPNPRMIENEDGSVRASQEATIRDTELPYDDRDWVKRAFLINDNGLADPDDIANRYWSSASAKFTDTRLGANIGINCKPQYTRYCDIRVKGRLAGRNDVTLHNTQGNYGMGDYYSRAIDDPSQTIYLRFGVPKFNSLINFMRKAFDTNMTSIARTGRAKGAFYNAGKLAGTVAVAIAVPAIALTVAAGRAIEHFFTRPTSKFYTLKPTMHLYWSTVNMLTYTWMINRGIFPKAENSLVNAAMEAMGAVNEGSGKINQPHKIDQDMLDLLHDLLPDVFRSNSQFDLYAIANKAQRLANAQFMQDFDNLNVGTATDYTGYVKKELTGRGSHITYISDEQSEPTLAARINKILTFGEYTVKEDGPRMEMDPRINPDDPNGAERKDPGFFGAFKEYFDAEFRQGSQFASFKVDHTGPVNEAFGNATVESKISQDLNGISSQVRDARFAFADGNILPGIGGMVEGVLGAAKDVVTGALDGATFGFTEVISGLAGSGFIDIPKHWQSSSATLSRTSYTIKLRSPYGNPISQAMDIYIPLFMLMAGTLPLATGKQSYTSPFLCQLFDRGRQQVQLGIIESLTISRGVTNQGFDLKGNALGIDVTLTIADLSSIMHMPVSGGGLFGIDSTIDEDNLLMDYMAVLAGQDIYSQIYPMAKAKLVVAKDLAKLGKMTSPAYWSSMFHESSTNGALAYTPIGWAGKGLEALVTGANNISSGGPSR